MFEVSIRTSPAYKNAIDHMCQDIMMQELRMMEEHVGNYFDSDSLKMAVDRYFQPYDFESQYPFDLVCPGPRYDDSPEGNCGDCPYMRRGKCEAPEEDDEDPYMPPEDEDDGPPDLPEDGGDDDLPQNAPFGYEFYQVYYNDERPVLKIEWRVSHWFTGISKTLMRNELEFCRIDMLNHSVPYISVNVDADIFKEYGTAVLMEEVLGEELEVTQWTRVEKRESAYNEKN